MNTTTRLRYYTSANVPAGAIAKSANNYPGRLVYTYHDAHKKAAELCMPYHTNDFGASCYNAEQATRIRAELIKDTAKKSEIPEALEIPELQEAQDTRTPLSEYSPAELVAYLRGIGYNVTCTRTIEEAL